MYFLIRCTEDGISIKQLTEAQLKADIKENIEECSPEYHYQFMKKIPEIDKGCWFRAPESGVVIIKGEIIVPKPKKVVTEYDL